jgi:hypothetical protein
MESVKRFEDIQPDTSLYENPINKGLARAKCALAQEGGAQCEIKGPHSGSWSGNYTRYEFTDSAYTDYRVKPKEPVVEEKREWVVITNIGRVDDSVQQTREAALRVAARYAGEVSIESHYVTYTDGIETARRVYKA